MTAFDLEKTKEILKHFYTLTKIKICVFDCNGVEIAYYPQKHTPFCTYVSSSPEGCRRCNASVENAFQMCRNEEKPILYTCDMGLIECAFPIIHNTVTIGYVMLGQTRDRKEPDATSLKRLSEECHLDYNQLSQLFNDIQYHSHSTIESAAKIMEACASYIYLYGLVDVDEDDLQLRIRQYIATNLKSELQVDGLCRAFGLSRTAMYQFFHKAYGTTVRQFIFDQRIARAKELLKSSSAPISEIAISVGIRDYNYFIRAFRQTTGISPLQYRKQFRSTRFPENSGIESPV